MSALESPQEDVLVSVRGLKTYYSLRGSFGQRLVGREAGHVKAVDDVSFDLYRGEVLGLVGESGSGKTTLGRTLLGLVPATEGTVTFEGEEITHKSERDLRALRRRMQIVFQDPHASLNPAMTIEQSVGHPLTIHRIARGGEYRRRVSEALETVGLAPAEQFLDKYPSDLSGGQKQRAVIARAIILNPLLLVADEPVSMLDMSVRAKILELMLNLKREFRFTYLYITHDLATAKFFCDRIAILYLGRIVEMGPSAAIYDDPKHPYTKALLRAIPEPDPLRSVPRDLPRGEVPDAASPPLGCSFHPRCSVAFEVCGWESRDLRDLLEIRWAQLSEAEFEAERSTIGDIVPLDAPSTSFRLAAGSGREGGDVLTLLETIRRETPDEPFWKGVRKLTAADRYVEVELFTPLVPRLLPLGSSQVECHLYDHDALQEAGNRRAETL
ncbi:MAG: ABC transporter ATP-binding protein [Thermoleophilia bacterium]|nr:ABC transporter ATP-binding protein [Thermoleophilia bacterium]MDH4340602.1 ABC transporter ATP-binding protein [Thermoleophilia bacterium]MDH5280355.1 ABC transporter ATP-binding protein [Thermoleophilia bacterium]